jgi:hypothetical protein
MSRCVIIALILLATLRASAVAQACLGLASFSTGPIQVTGEASIAGGSSTFAGGASYGWPTSFFGGGTVGTSSVEAFNGSAIDLGATVGYQVTWGVGSAVKLQLCPLASFGLEIGPNDTFDSPVDRSSRTASAGLALGTSLGRNPRMQILPTVSLALAHGTSQATDGAGNTLFEISDVYALGQVGVGVVMNSAISVRSTLQMPLGLQGTDPTFALTVGYNFGNKRTAQRD